MNDDTLCTISSCMIEILSFIEEISILEQMNNQ